MRFFALVVKTKYTIICVLINSKFFFVFFNRNCDFKFSKETKRIEFGIIILDE